SRVLVLTGVQNPDAHRSAIRRGAMGIVLKEHAADQLLKAIMKVHEGEVWIERSMMGNMIQEFNKPTTVDPEIAKIESLTDREREVIALVGEGLKNKQVGERLFISETTVTHHLSSVFSKLDVSDRLELIIYAFRHGLAKMPKQYLAETCHTSKLKIRALCHTNGQGPPLQRPCDTSTILKRKRHGDSTTTNTYFDSG